MKKENLFDILEKAEDESMERLIDKCPEISDEELDKILDMSERKFNMKKRDMNKNVQRENGITVSGVERVKRPAWIKPFTMAASFVLVAGMVVGTVALMNKGKSGSSDTDKIAADVFNDKDALKALCSDAPSHYDKLEASCTISYTRDDLSITENEKVEYNSKEKYLFMDEREDHKEPYNPEADGETYFIHYLYKNKSTTISPDWNWYEVDTLNNDWDYDNYSLIDVNGQPFFDPKPIFDPDTTYLSSSQSLLNKDEWSITGTETICGRECVAVSQESDAYKLNDYFDSETGVLLKSVYEDVNNNEQTVFEVTDIKYNEDAHVTTPLEFRKMIEEAGYEPFYPDGSVDPKVACNLDFLGIPNQPFTTAAGKKELVTTTTTAAEPEDITTEPVTTETPSDDYDIDDVVGQWEYQISDGTHTAGENPVYNGVITIYPTAIYEYTDVNGNVTEGTVRLGYEEIAGSQLPKVDFYESTAWSFGGYYNGDEINIGNGGMSRLVRSNGTTSTSTYIAGDDAFDAVSNYCHKKYDWSAAKENPDIMYVTKGNVTDTEYEILFRSYTGAFVYFYVNNQSGNCRIMEENPITNEMEETGTINIFDYMNE